MSNLQSPTKQLAAFRDKEFFTLHNGEKAPLPFSDQEYENRLAKLRSAMAEKQIEAVLFTSMHNIAYYSGFLYCSFGRPYGLVVTDERALTISANIDFSQPWRRCFGENIIYTDWKRDNYFRAVRSALEGKRRIGVEFDHLTRSMETTLAEFLDQPHFVDIAPTAMKMRMIKSQEEIALIKSGAKTADIGGYAIHDTIQVGMREIDIAMIGRNAMEVEIARSHPDSELRDNWVWFQSGINSDGAHNPVTTRELKQGDILSLNAFPMISGYYTALERTLFLGEPDAASRKVWEANIGAHELGLSLIKPGAKCSDICAELNRYFAELGLLEYRTFGYGHSFGVLSHYYGREAGLELREDIDTVIEKGMVISMEPMLTIPEGNSGAGGYREHDIVVIQDDHTVENITKYPYGPEFNVIDAAS